MSKELRFGIGQRSRSVPVASAARRGRHCAAATAPRRWSTRCPCCPPRSCVHQDCQPTGWSRFSAPSAERETIGKARQPSDREISETAPLQRGLATSWVSEARDLPVINVDPRLPLDTALPAGCRSLSPGWRRLHVSRWTDTDSWAREAGDRDRGNQVALTGPGASATMMSPDPLGRGAARTTARHHA
jgi:hypothetical protein